MKALKSAVFCAALLSVMGAAPNSKAEVKVVASIKPVHSLAAAVMKGLGEPILLLEGANSPHSYALRPSQAKSLQEAQVVFWIGPNLEQFLTKAIETTGQTATSVVLIDTEGLTRLKFRGEHHHDHGHGHGEKKHEEHGHKKHDEDKHEKRDEHAHDKHDEHAHDKHNKHEDHAEHDDHGAGDIDPHVWLDPENAKVIVDAIAAALVKADPGSAQQYQKNASVTKAELDELTHEVSHKLENVSDKPFIVFHDAYQYFEARFGMKSAGSITLSPEVSPGAERLKEIKHQIEDMGATCVFSEPQFKPKLVKLVVEGTSAKTAEIDPLGAGIPAGPDHYGATIRTMAKNMRDCLS